MRPFSEQRRALKVSLLFVFLPMLALLGVAALAIVRGTLPANALLTDPAAFAGLPFYTGALSNVGVLLWTSAATTCLFTHVVARSPAADDGATGRTLASPAAMKKAAAASRPRRFLLHVGLLTLWLMLDDLFLIHEAVVPHVLGLPGDALYVAYGAAVAGVLLAHRVAVLESDFVLLLAAALLFAVSLLADLAMDRAGVRVQGLGSIEDTSKLMGIAAWFAYLTRFCAERLRQ